MNDKKDHHPAQVLLWWVTGIGLVCAGAWSVFTYTFPQPTVNGSLVGDAVTELEELKFVDQSRIEYKLAPNGKSSEVTITAHFEAYASDGSNPDADSISEKAMFKGVIVVNGEFCSKTVVYHNRGPDPEAARILRGTTSCVRLQKLDETLLILAERKEAHHEFTRKVELLIKRRPQ